MTTQALNRISSEAVKKATGKTWDEWLTILDKEGAKGMAHKDIALLLQKRYIKSGWWCQMVTVGYEYARNKRVIGKTADVEFEIGVTKTIKGNPKKIWEFLMSAKGRAIWLGESADFKLVARSPYKTKNSTTGQVRTVHNGERVRLTFQPKGFKQASALQLTVTPRKSTNGTCISFHQEKLASAKQRETMRKYWQGVLEKLVSELLK